MLIFWIIVFVVSMVALVKGADWLIMGAEKMGLAFGLSPFIVGVTIVSVGTSLPELVSSFVAVFQGVADVVVANAVGSNIANILLVIGVSAVVGRQIIIKKSLIDLDLPLLAITTVLLLGVVWDKQVTLGEAILMLATYGIYLLYTILHKDGTKKEEIIRPKVTARDPLLLVVGIFALTFGAKYLIEALVNLSTMLNVATGVIAITAVAIGTSLPELLVSVKAAFQKKSEIAIGNILGSNVFNSLVVVGLPGLFHVLPVDDQTFMIGLPAVAAATFIFVISGITKNIYAWEGAFYLSLYTLFIAKLFGWF